ncbi:nitroreductase family protein [Clostridium formicaceticum]|uniref:Nitroreductase n=1 Tax=Clostridium formicaceticum TaxID=1497 RepID=A0AAC9WIS5_9CLOT|nr:nitroreductase family protein [Clostridium formicaceticum]AOY74534.1 nitroreductase [Clostridium formicaceticum]ARE88890.1 Nitroreductase family protein [Clostridium formicaceticum]
MKQHFKKPIMEVIKSRYSVRTYRPEKLSEEIKEEIREYAAALKGPFGPKVRLELIDCFEILEKNGGKIGTYGVIKGAQDYIAAIVENGEKDLEALGYVLEKFILYAASINLGTCWLGGTFKRNQFVKMVALKDNEKLPIVTPIGYPEDKKSVVESFMRFAVGANKRKSWHQLFFDESFNKPLKEKGAKEYLAALEAIRLAPSASNKQPWRIVKKEKVYHFYLKRDQGYGEKLGFNIQRIDMGIAMCHFEMVLQELGVKGNWIIENPQVDPAGIENLGYVVSWVE